MALAHNYHPHCGCYTCGRQERADELADELALGLHKSPAILSEAIAQLADEQISLLAQHLEYGNDAALGEILRTLVSDYIAGEIERRMDETNASRIETVQHMLTVYEVPRAAPAMPWRVAA